MIHVTGQNCLPLIFYGSTIGGYSVGAYSIGGPIVGAAVVVAVRHVACFGQIEYRIGCHNGPSLTLGVHVNYPDLAVKLISPVMRMRTLKRILVSEPVILLFSLAMMGQNTPPSKCASPSSEIVASHVAGEIRLDAGHPANDWQRAQPIRFCSDWQGKNPDEQRETEVRVLWTSQTLYLRFECRYRELYVFQDSDSSNGRRDHLWDRDVAEAFLQPDPSRARYYREFEVSPNGMWIDLDIFPGGLADLESGMKRSVFLDEKEKRWAAELAIPLRALTPAVSPKTVWRANFYRVEGNKEPRAYLAWRPTGTPQPNFHVPAAFGMLRFAPGNVYGP